MKNTNETKKTSQQLGQEKKQATFDMWEARQKRWNAWKKKQADLQR